MPRYMLFPPFRDARGALTLKRHPDLSPFVLPPQFSIDELRRQMDKKHNIRNMSVIAHVDHVSAPTERRARVSGVDCAGVSIALSEPPSTGFGFAGWRTVTRDASASRTRAGDPGASEASPAFPATARTHLACRPTPSRPVARPPFDANCPHARSPSVRFSDLGVSNEKPSVDVLFFSKTKTETLTPRSSLASSLFPRNASRHRASPPSRTLSSPPRVSSRRRTRATRA